MKLKFIKKVPRLAATLVFIGVFLCLAGPALATESHDFMSSPASCQTMQVNLAALTPEGRTLGSIGLLLLSLFFIRALGPKSVNLGEQTAAAFGPAPGSQWRLFQHVFLDSLYRQFSPARQYAAVIVEPQTYSA